MPHLKRSTTPSFGRSGTPGLSRSATPLAPTPVHQDLLDVEDGRSLDTPSSIVLFNEKEMAAFASKLENNSYNKDEEAAKLAQFLLSDTTDYKVGNIFFLSCYPSKF